MARPVIIKTWISTTGEIFEGSQKELMDAFGIKNNNGFKRATGAVDENGDRWLAEEDFKERGFQKPNLYLGVQWFKDKDHKGNNRDIGQEPSETAAIYCIYEDYINNNRDGEFVKEARQFIQETHNKFQVVDNRVPTEGHPLELLRHTEAQLDAAFTELESGTGTEAKFWALQGSIHKLRMQAGMLKVKLFGADAMRPGMPTLTSADYQKG